MIYTVRSGDTAFSVAQSYGVSLSRLIFDNQLPADGELVPGQALLILIPEVTAVVEPGDTLLNIAARYGTTAIDLLRKNPFLANTPLLSGESIIISYAEQGERECRTLGYAYPFINLELLRETLPFLDSLYCFSYGFTSEGLLVPENDAVLREQAALFGAEAILVLTPRTGEEAFDNRLINDIVNDPEASERLIALLIEELLNKGYAGLDLDFEYIEARNRGGYSDLARRFAEALHAEGLSLSAALAPKTSRDQPGLLYEGIDYAALGQYADSVMLMTYEWGYTYGPPLAVAPLPNVRAVLEYALSEIPPEKIMLGIPNYGYDWPLPYLRGTTAATTIGSVEAVELARRYGVSILFDERSMSPYFEYTADGVEHVVWFEDVRSISAKLGLVSEYGLRGAGWWSLMRPFRANWLLTDQTFRLR